MQTTDASVEAARPPFTYVIGASGRAAGTFVEAVEACLQDLESKLAEVDCVLDDVVNVRAYLPSSVMTATGYAEYNNVYNRFFHAHGIFRKPARATVGIDPLRGVEVTMEAIALRCSGTPAQER